MWVNIEYEVRDALLTITLKRFLSPFLALRSWLNSRVIERGLFFGSSHLIIQQYLHHYHYLYPPLLLLLEHHQCFSEPQHRLFILGACDIFIFFLTISVGLEGFSRFIFCNNVSWVQEYNGRIATIFHSQGCIQMFGSLSFRFMKIVGSVAVGYADEILTMSTSLIKFLNGDLRGRTHNSTFFNRVTGTPNTYITGNTKLPKVNQIQHHLDKTLLHPHQLPSTAAEENRNVTVLLFALTVQCDEPLFETNNTRIRFLDGQFSLTVISKKP
ncbi:hypothetical protein MKW98_003100 [Papaver atlanticum]|uniref:Uncharacterized protein n=1 Tax=Papaver atlanticum TaxID=357466 RepID=A0AAD4THV4_9MAGN|nr:hypothetical protein MKW98_003100 [Papaver atlanticum]